MRLTKKGVIFVIKGFCVVVTVISGRISKTVSKKWGLKFYKAKSRQLHMWQVIPKRKIMSVKKRKWNRKKRELWSELEEMLTFLGR